jgi:D-alanyl-D-alanine carboxypeptidase/D-alanyl-D-alanine-endopeptidase (penicillin-binding protein 4)
MRRPSAAVLATLLLAFPALPLPAAPSRTAASAPVKKPAPAQPATLKGALDNALRGLRGAAAEVAVQVVEVESGQPIYSADGEKSMIIASNTKLITSAAALDRLGPDFQFETQVQVRGEVRDGVLHGDLAVIGGGDPNISGRFYEGDSFAVFKAWAAKLQELGIRKVDGDLLLVTGFFDDALIHPDWARAQLDRWYQAPVSALSFNDNCVLVKVQPTPSAQATVKLEPSLPIFKLNGRVGIAAKGRGQNVMIGRRLEGDAQTLATYTVGGQISRRAGKVDEWITVADPVGYFAAGLVQAFGEQGIAFKGAPQSVAALPPGEWRPAAVHHSPLTRTLAVVNKRSQNFYAECVMKTLGAKFGGGGSWPQGVKVAAEFLQRIGIAPESYSLMDGSGLSRNDRFSPKQITHLLRHMFFHKYGSEYVRTLPFSGEEDLRWASRLARAPYRGNVMAKTGTLSGVSTLSGYAKAVSGKIYAFSILCNRTQANFRAQSAQDAFLRALIDRG